MLPAIPVPNALLAQRNSLQLRLPPALRNPLTIYPSERSAAAPIFDLNLM